MAETVQFVDCSSLNISIDRLGYVTLSFTIISDGFDIEIPTSYFGVTGWPTYIKQEPMQGLREFVTTQVNIKGTRDGD